MTRLLYSILICSLCSCALFKGKKEIEGIRLDYKKDAKINYGHSFTMNTVVFYSNGKTKNITSKKELTVKVSGAEYNKGKVSIDNRPQALRSDTIFVTASYVDNEKTYELKEAIPFNYQGELLVTFRGTEGAEGEQGRSRSTPLLLRDGKTGYDGGQGETGGNGDDLTVNIWKESNSDRYRIKVANMTTNLTYEYTFRDRGFGIRFDVSGGVGGPGGDAGDGGDGKDGLISEKKRKLPGDGGNGGNGGIGGTGGTGGTVYVFLHPNAAELKSKIAVYNFGGAGGAAGKAGKAGKGGEPAEGQDLVPDGEDGIDGVVGQDGDQGEPFQILIEDFDIED